MPKLRANAPVFTMNYSKSNRNNTFNFSISTFNILSTFRTIDVKETPQMFSDRYLRIIQHLITNNSDCYLLQEVDEEFIKILTKILKFNIGLYEIIGPKYFSLKKDKIGTVILIKTSKLGKSTDLTENCQKKYIINSGSKYFVPFRGQCVYLELEGNPIILSNVHHSRKQESLIPDSQLRITIDTILQVVSEKGLLEIPFIAGGDFYYSGTQLQSYFNSLYPNNFHYVPINHNTSYHKYIKPNFKKDEIKVKLSSQTTDQILFTKNIGYKFYEIYPIDGMWDDQNLPYYYPNLENKINYSIKDFDKIRQINPYINSDHAIITSYFKLNKQISRPRRGPSKKRKTSNARNQRKTKKGNTI